MAGTAYLGFVRTGETLEDIVEIPQEIGMVKTFQMLDRTVDVYLVSGDVSQGLYERVNVHAIYIHVQKLTLDMKISTE